MSVNVMNSSAIEQASSGVAIAPRSGQMNKEEEEEEYEPV